MSPSRPGQAGSTAASTNRPIRPSMKEPHERARQPALTAEPVDCRSIEPFRGLGPVRPRSRFGQPDTVTPQSICRSSGGTSVDRRRVALLVSIAAGSTLLTSCDPGPPPPPERTQWAGTTAAWSGTVRHEWLDGGHRMTSEFVVSESGAIKRDYNDAWVMGYDYVGTSSGRYTGTSCNPGPDVKTWEGRSSGTVEPEPIPGRGVQLAYAVRSADPVTLQDRSGFVVGVNPTENWRETATSTCNSQTTVSYPTVGISIGAYNSVDLPPTPPTQRVLKYDTGWVTCSASSTSCSTRLVVDLHRGTPLTVKASYNFSAGNVGGRFVYATGTDEVSITGPRLDLVTQVCADAYWTATFTTRDSTAVTWQINNTGDFAVAQAIALEAGGPVGIDNGLSIDGAYQRLRWSKCVAFPASGVLRAADFGFPTKVAIGPGELGWAKVKGVTHSMVLNVWGKPPSGGPYTFLSPNLDVTERSLDIPGLLDGSSVSILSNSVQREF